MPSLGSKFVRAGYVEANQNGELKQQGWRFNLTSLAFALIFLLCQQGLEEPAQLAQ